MQTFNDLIKVEFIKLVGQSIHDLKELVSQGNCESFESYKYNAGRIAGLNEALTLLDEAHDNVYKPPTEREKL